ncbi:MAG: hypothetical protein GY811_14820 [Myxococcales bacterium]|nr:hypothetical protein [Myxococcales bacterium]
MGRLLKLVVPALMLTACSSEPPSQAAIRLALSLDEIGGCQTSSCEDYGMSCGATVSLRLTDYETGELLHSQNGQGQPLSVCQEAGVNGDICTLADLTPRMVLDGMPPETMRVEVAVWSAEYTCDDIEKLDLSDLLDLYGRPKEGFSSQPAFAGAKLFRAGIDADITVPLNCSAPDLLDAKTCAANLPTNVSAAVTDMDAVQQIREEQAINVSVKVGVPEPKPDGQGGSYYVLEQAQLSELALDTDGATPSYLGAIPLPFVEEGGVVCSAVQEYLAQATTSVTCEEVDNTSEDFSLSPLLLSKETLDAILDALSLENFPETGILIGRVVDEGFSPIAGVAVTPSDGSTVLYLNDDLSVASQGLSSSSAFFASTNAAFGSSWTAAVFDGRRHSGKPRGGLVRGKVSTLLIRMTGEVNQ